MCDLVAQKARRQRNRLNIAITKRFEAVKLTFTITRLLRKSALH